MKLTSPFQKTEQNNDFARFKNIWTAFVKEYNLDKPSREQLKHEHRDTYYAIIKLVKLQIDSVNINVGDSPIKHIESTEPYKLRTNRYALSCFFNREKSKGTIANYLKRMVDAGVIVDRKNHGAKADFDLYINPDFLLIFDYDREDYTPNSPYLSKKLKPENRASKTPMLQNLNPCSGRFEKQFNNSIIDKAFSENENNSYPEQSGNNFENTPKQRKIELEPQIKNDAAQHTETNVSGTEKEKSSAKKEKESFVAGLAMLFYLYMVERLFKNHDINPVHAQKAQKYIENTYFMAEKRHYTEDELWKYWEMEYKPRIDMAASYIERHNFNMDNWFPVAYLNVENSRGFAYTKKWFKSNKEREAHSNVKKIANSRKLSDYDKMHNMLKLFSKNRNKDYYDYCTQYVKKVIPQYTNDFMAAIRPMANV